MMNKMGKTAPLPATNSTPSPGNFPLFSLESRAAARMLAARREDAKKRIEFVTNLARFTWVGDDPMPEDWGAQPHATPWNDCGDCLTRIVYIPDELDARQRQAIMQELR